MLYLHIVVVVSVENETDVKVVFKLLSPSAAF